MVRTVPRRFQGGQGAGAVVLVTLDDLLKNFLPRLREEVELPVYLETNGVLPDHLAEVIELVDIVALDLKLPSATGLSPYWKEHAKALETASEEGLQLVEDASGHVSLVPYVESGFRIVML